MIRVNGTRIYYHRFVFENEVRPLEPGEIVHHIDENKRNNAADNLEVLSDRAAHLHQHNYHRRIEEKAAAELRAALDDGIPF